MKMFKRVLGLSLVAVSTFALASCSKETRNQQVPYGSVGDSVVASAGDYSISQKQLYNRLKYSYGYTVFTNKLNSLVYKTEYANFKYEGDNKISIDESVASAVYGSSDLDTLRTMTAEQKEQKITSYIYSIRAQGIIISDRNSLVFDTITDSTEHVSFSKLPQAVINYYSTDLVKKAANIKYLESIANQEYIVDENDANIETENSYYISDDDLENKYNQTYKDYNTSYGVVIKFSSLSEANRYITEIGGINTENVEQQYIKLYNAYYSYKTPLTAETIKENENTTFLNDADHTDLTNYSSTVTDFFLEVLKDGEGLTTPRNIDGSYYLIYRKEVVYQTTGTNETVEYNELDTLGADKAQEVKDACKESIIEENASSVNSTVFEDRVEDLGIVIYDPFIENTFANSYTSYDYTTTFDNNLIFSTTSEGNYSVDDYYNDLINYNVTETVVTLLTNQMLLSLANDSSNEVFEYLTDDLKDSTKEAIDNNIKSFNNGSTALNKLYGESNYLFYNYGYYTYDEAYNAQLASSIQTSYLADYIYNNWAGENHSLATDNLNILQNILNTALAVYADRDFLDLTVDHILISVDNDGDGQPDDMDLFLASLSDEEKVKFQTAVNNLAKAILAEATAISDHTNMEKLTYIVEAFNRNFPTHQGPTWDTYKTYNFILTAESLGEVTTSSVSNYVEPFQNYLYELYDKAVADNLNIPEEDEDNGIFYSPNGAVTTDSYQDLDLTATDTNSTLCQTNYGFHLLSLNSYEKDTDAELDFRFTASTSDEQQENNIKVVLNEFDEDNDDDDLYVNTNVYNTNEDKSVPTIEQVFVYYVEYTQGDVTSFRTSIENDLSALLDTVISHYQTSNFQKYLLYARLGSISTNNLGIFDYQFYMDSLRDSNESYDSESPYLSWYSLDNSINWTR